MLASLEKNFKGFPEACRPFRLDMPVHDSGNFFAYGFRSWLGQQMAHNVSTLYCSMRGGAARGFPIGAVRKIRSLIF